MGILPASLVGCEKKDVSLPERPAQTEVLIQTEAEVPEAVVETANEICSGGKIIALSTISGTSWIGGVGKTRPSLLLESNSNLDINNVTSVKLAHEAGARAVKSARVLGNGRMVVILEGGEIADKESIDEACFISKP